MHLWRVLLSGHPRSFFRTVVTEDEEAMATDLQDLSQRLFAAANQLWTNTALRPDQAKYIGVPVQGPYKADTYRY